MYIYIYIDDLGPKISLEGEASHLKHLSTRPETSRAHAQREGAPGTVDSEPCTPDISSGNLYGTYMVKNYIHH